MYFITGKTCTVLNTEMKAAGAPSTFLKSKQNWAHKKEFGYYIWYLPNQYCLDIENVVGAPILFIYAKLYISFISVNCEVWAQKTHMKFPYVNHYFCWEFEFNIPSYIIESLT